MSNEMVLYQSQLFILDVRVEGIEHTFLVNVFPQSGCVHRYSLGPASIEEYLLSPYLDKKGTDRSWGFECGPTLVPSSQGSRRMRHQWARTSQMTGA